MIFTYDPNLYHLEDGRHLAQFMGVKEFDKSQLRNNPYPDSGPVVRWSFKIMTGSDKDKEAFTITPQHPTPKNACMRMITGIIGHAPKENEPVNVGAFAGNFYVIVIHEGKLSHQFAPMKMGPNWNNAKTMFDAMNELPADPPPSDEPTGF